MKSTLGKKAPYGYIELFSKILFERFQELCKDQCSLDSSSSKLEVY